MSGTARTELLPALGRTAVPWKNGGGVTREIIAYPSAASLDNFDWRVSTAEVRVAGAFSVFAGVERTLCVLEGRLALAIQGRTPSILVPDSAPFAFAGDLEVHADPGSAPVVDLNVMTRRGHFVAAVKRLGFSGSLRRDSAATMTLLFALTSLRVEVGAESSTLSRHDALRLREGTPCTLVAPEARAECYVIEIAALAFGAGRT